jgi:hypothetical protein
MTRMMTTLTTRGIDKTALRRSSQWKRKRQEILTRWDNRDALTGRKMKRLHCHHLVDFQEEADYLTTDLIVPVSSNSHKFLERFAGDTIQSSIDKLTSLKSNLEKIISLLQGEKDDKHL